MTNQIRCYGCNYLKPESEVTCLRCLTTCKIELANLPILLRHASNFLQPGNGGHGSSSNERTIGVNPQALNYVAGHDQLNFLYGWQDWIRDQLGEEPRLKTFGAVEVKVEKAVEYLQIHWVWLIKQPKFNENNFMLGVRKLHGAGLAITQFTSPKTTQLACPTRIEGRPCSGKLEIDTRDLTSETLCKKCGSVRKVAFLLKVSLEESKSNASPNHRDELWLNPDEISLLLDISENHIRKVVKKYSVPKWGSLINLPKFLIEYEKQSRKASK